MDLSNEFPTTEDRKNLHMRRRPACDCCAEEFVNNDVDPDNLDQFLCTPCLQEKVVHRKIRITYGDYGPIFYEMIQELRKAKEFSANNHQRAMINRYLTHFEYGELSMHKLSQEAWVKDATPSVETNIGFIENYRDGYGERAEFEG